MAQTNLLGFEFSEISRAIRDLPGLRPFTARQLYGWIYVKRARTFDVMTNLPLSLRTALTRDFTIRAPSLDRLSISSDGTRKYLFSLEDRNGVESVWIPEESRNTLCLSTQVGCRMNCRFCATARMGFVRNLSAGEIVGQAMHMLDEIGYRDRRVNIVFMGMGEGLDNYDSTMGAFRLLSDPDGIAISPRRITLSTAGLVPGIERLSHEPRAPKLAVSLNSPFDSERSSLMPINRRYPISQVIEAVTAFIHAQHGGERIRLNERVTFEYILLKGVNDTPAHAQELIRLLRNVPSKLNLLTHNPAEGLPFERCDDEWIESFKERLLAANVPVSFRRSRGRDIEAACGQLATAVAEAGRVRGAKEDSS